MEAATVTLTVSEGSSGRIDVFIAQTVEEASRTQVQRSIRCGAVRLNGKVVLRPSVLIADGDQIVWTRPVPEPLVITPEPVALDLVYEDKYLIVVNKPAGMPTHPGPGHWRGTLVHALLHHVGGDAVTENEHPRDRELGLSCLYEGSSVRPGIVHRLDMDTSGLLVVAKDDVTHRGLGKQFEERTIHRVYHGILWGKPTSAQGRIEAPIGRDPRDRKKMAVVSMRRGKHAVTHYSVLKEHAFTAQVTFKLETGRTHQIRVHAQHIGHPLLGDATYGGRRIVYGPATRRRKATYSNILSILSRQALHAQSLRFAHPRSGEVMKFESALPADMREAVRRIEAGDS